jgi:hypothetical protein
MCSKVLGQRNAVTIIVQCSAPVTHLSCMGDSPYAGACAADVCQQYRRRCGAAECEEEQMNSRAVLYLQLTEQQAIPELS